MQRPESISLFGRDVETRSALLGLLLLRSAALGALLAAVLHSPSAESLFHPSPWFGVGFAAGWLIGWLNPHPHRRLGRVPLGMSALALALAWSALGGAPSWLLLGFFLGVVDAPLSLWF